VAQYRKQIPNFDVSTNISASSDRKRMKLPPFDAARRGGSNELRYIFLRSLDAELFNKTVRNGFFISEMGFFMSLLYLII
jgi:hypothetical protein